MELCAHLFVATHTHIHTQVYMAESLHCSPETMKTFLFFFTPRQNKTFYFKYKLEMPFNSLSRVAQLVLAGNNAEMRGITKPCLNLSGKV